MSKRFPAHHRSLERLLQWLYKHRIPSASRKVSALHLCLWPLVPMGLALSIKHALQSRVTILILLFLFYISLTKHIVWSNMWLYHHSTQRGKYNNSVLGITGTIQTMLSRVFPCLLFSADWVWHQSPL